MLAQGARRRCEYRSSSIEYPGSQPIAGKTIITDNVSNSKKRQGPQDVKDPSGWKRMMFKGMKVWLHVDDDQRPVVRDSKVLIKYQLDQDHEYRVRKETVEAIAPARLRKRPTRRGLRPKANARKNEHDPVDTINRVDHKPYLTGEPDDLRDAFRPKTIVAYTDGASSGNPGPAGIGIVLRFGPKEKEISKHIGIATNNVAELMAIKTALKAIRTPQIPVRLYTDSQYCFGLLSLGWKPRRNEKLVADIKKLMERFKNLKILKIEAHAGIHDNERADRLARTATSGISKPDINTEPQNVSGKTARKGRSA
jgi:ribonuclease HI